MSAKRPSIAWEHFTKLGEECTCIHCGKVLKYNRSRTTNLLKHLRIHGIPRVPKLGQDAKEAARGNHPSPDEPTSQDPREEYLNSSTSTESHASFKFDPALEKSRQRTNPFTFNGSSILNHPAPAPGIDDPGSVIDTTHRFLPLKSISTDPASRALGGARPAFGPTPASKYAKLAGEREVDYLDGYGGHPYVRSYSGPTPSPEAKRLEEDLVDLFYHWNLPYQMIDSEEFNKLLKNLTTLPILNSNQLKCKILEKIKMRDGQ